MSFQIKLNSVVTVPSWPNSGKLTVKQDHGNEVTLSNGERIYKAKCVIDVRESVKNRRLASEKILNKKKK